MSGKFLLTSSFVLVGLLAGCSGGLSEQDEPAPITTPQPTADLSRVELATKYLEITTEVDGFYEEIASLIEEEDYDRLCANLEGYRSRQVRLHATMTAVEEESLGQPDRDMVEYRSKREEAFDEVTPLCALLVTVSTPTSKPQPRPTITPAIRTPTPIPEPNPESVGQIGVRTSAGEGHGGSGFVIGVDGVRAYVVTNHHVVDDAEIMVFALGGKLYDDVTLLGSHEHEDVAVLSVCCDLFTVLPSSTEPVTPGTVVEVTAMPGESDEVIRTRGKVLRLTQRYGSSSPVIEHTAELHPGSSGSPLLNTAGEVIGINKGTNVKDATRFVATNYASVKSLIARWTGQVVSEADVAQAEPSMWVFVTDDEIYVDTEFDFTDEFGMDVLVDGEEYCNPQRIYADEGRYALGCESPDKSHASAERVSVQTDGGFDLRCQKDEELSNEQETVFACVWR